MLYTGWKSKDDNIELIKENAKLINFRENYLVGLGLGVDDFAQALGLSFAGFPIILTVFLLELSEMTMLLASNSRPKYVRVFLKRYFD
jgi:putative Mn2+ efflux pump MntP